MQTPIHKLIIIPFLALSVMVAFPARVQAQGGANLPSLDEFIAQVINGNEDELRGMYVPGVLAHTIVPQPEGNPMFISSEASTLTRFEMASQFGTIGLLAHNYIAGSDFYLLEEDQELYLIDGAGHVEIFIIREFMRYQALSPQDTASDFVDLETGEMLSASQLFMKVFQREGDVVLQTCIYADGEASWGRLFIIAVPYIQHAPISMPGRFEFQ